MSDIDDAWQDGFDQGAESAATDIRNGFIDQLEELRAQIKQLTEERDYLQRDRDGWYSAYRSTRSAIWNEVKP